VQFEWKLKSKDSEGKFLRSTFQKVANVDLQAAIQITPSAIGKEIPQFNNNVATKQHEEYEDLFGEELRKPQNIPSANSDRHTNAVTIEEENETNNTFIEEDANENRLEDEVEAEVEAEAAMNQEVNVSQRIGHEIEGVEIGASTDEMQSLGGESGENTANIDMQSRDEIVENSSSISVNNNAAATTRFPRESKKRNWKQFEDDPWKKNRPRLSFQTSLAEEVQEGKKYAIQTKAAIMDEIRNMINYRIGVYRHRDEIEDWLRVLNTFMIIKHKLKPDGSYDRTKGRFTVNGKE
jgi:hypothetical protein